MDKLSCMRSFVAVVETGSFSEAALKLRQSASYISKQVANLEMTLGVQLLNRTTRRVHLTDEGRNYAEWCQNILGEIEEVEANLQHEHKKPSGLLRISAPTTIGRMYVSKAVACFLKKYPDVQIELDLSDQRVDLVEQGYDMAIRVGTALQDSSLKAKKLATAHGVLCASPDYIQSYGAPTKIKELTQHNILLYTMISRNNLTLVDKAGRKQVVRVSGQLYCNNGETLCQAALEGAGIGHFPSFIAGRYVSEGRLVPISLEDEQRQSLSVYAVYPQHRHLPSKVRAFIDYLYQGWNPLPPWDNEVETLP